MDFGVITSISIAVNLDSGENVRLAQVNVVGEDTVTVELPFPQGNEYVPAVGDTVYYAEVDSGLLVGHYIQSAVPVDGSLSTGEMELFSVSGTERRATVRLDEGGQVVLNAGDDYAIKFNELRTSLENLSEAYAQLWSLVFSHTHPYTNTPPSTTATALQFVGKVSPVLDMDGSRVEKVRL